MKISVHFWLLAFAAASPVVAAQQPTSSGEIAPQVQREQHDHPPSERVSDEEVLAIAALRALLAAPPERAFPLLQRVLDGSQSERVKIRALFVLAQTDLPEARALLLKTTQAQPTVSEKMRLEAIRMVGVNGDPATLQALRATYDSGDFKIKEAVIRAWQIAQAKPALLNVALTEENAQLVERAINALAAMGARAELGQLSAKGVDPNRMVKAYGISRDLDALQKLALESPDPEVQINAAKHIGIVGGADALLVLQTLYRQTASLDVKRGALEGMMIAGDAKGLMKLYRASNDPQEKRLLLEKLTVVGGDDALDAIDAALQGKSP